MRNEKTATMDNIKFLEEKKAELQKEYNRLVKENKSMMEQEKVERDKMVQGLQEISNKLNEDIEEIEFQKKKEIRENDLLKEKYKEIASKLETKDQINFRKVETSKEKEMKLEMGNKEKEVGKGLVSNGIDQSQKEGNKESEKNKEELGQEVNEKRESLEDEGKDKESAKNAAKNEIEKEELTKVMQNSKENLEEMGDGPKITSDVSENPETLKIILLQRETLFDSDKEETTAQLPKGQDFKKSKEPTGHEPVEAQNMLSAVDNSANDEKNGEVSPLSKADLGKEPRHEKVLEVAAQKAKSTGSFNIIEAQPSEVENCSIELLNEIGAYGKFRRNPEVAKFDRFLDEKINTIEELTDLKRDLGPELERVTGRVECLKERLRKYEEHEEQFEDLNEKTFEFFKGLKKTIEKVRHSES